MNLFALLAAGALGNEGIYWRLPILIVVISLVYSATRFEPWNLILRESLRWMLRMSVFLVAVALVLLLLDWWI
jgi:hypothetical protein